eukprot:CCRYP_021073-RA/>CCRYP_021073-RA protein AED:0.81 eAED:0.90 QI:0/0/0/0.33/1/1/6/0/76
MFCVVCSACVGDWYLHRNATALLKATDENGQHRVPKMLTKQHGYKYSTNLNKNSPKQDPTELEVPGRAHCPNPPEV